MSTQYYFNSPPAGQGSSQAVSPETVHPQVTGESLAQKWASAKQLHQHILIRRSLGNWKRLKDHRMVVEGRADRFWHMHTLRRALIALLDHVIQERMVEWDWEQQAQGHSDRWVCLPGPYFLYQ
ncbi:unnamed protein product [Oncorhynchus mykiss]|uniref:Uncharacterized protein n=1 Tax=Oncorhynchus mykiss TaxID=8022 RepID=A0A061A6T6_ONCMY|nr:unnamed protein product [Oncorhynchus mykiss]